MIAMDGILPLVSPKQFSALSRLRASAGLFRFATTASRRARSVALTSTMIPPHPLDSHEDEALGIRQRRFLSDFIH